MTLYPATDPWFNSGELTGRQLASLSCGLPLSRPYLDQWVWPRFPPQCVFRAPMRRSFPNTLPHHERFHCVDDSPGARRRPQAAPLPSRRHREGSRPQRTFHRGSRHLQSTHQPRNRPAEARPHRLLDRKRCPTLRAGRQTDGKRPRFLSGDTRRSLGNWSHGIFRLPLFVCPKISAWVPHFQALPPVDFSSGASPYPGHFLRWPSLPSRFQARLRTSTFDLPFHTRFNCTAPQQMERA